MSTDNDVMFLICSCDKYEDSWELCVKSIREYWKECPYPIALLSESKSGKPGLFSSVIHTQSTSWSEMLHEALEKIDAEYIMFMLEDQWPVENVNHDQIEKALEYIKSNEDVAAIYIESDEVGGIKKAFRMNDDFNEIPFGAPYRLSIAPSFFRKSFLYKITEGDISPWDFERIRSFDKLGESVRILELKNSRWKRIDPTGAIFRGKWVPGVKEYASKMDLKLDLSKRQELSGWEIRKRKIKDFIFSLNPELIVKIQKLISTKK